MKRQICSNDHFKRLLKSFEKIAVRVVYEKFGKKLPRKYFILNYIEYFSDSPDQSYFNLSLSKLLKNFKSNPFKTKSCIAEMNTAYSPEYIKFYVSYTFEDEFGKRSNEPKNIIFRLYVKSNNNRKQRVVRWIVPITWEYLNK